jgi:putative ABC transport system permease protein
LLSGDLNRALNTPENIAISKSEAIRLFGSADVVGKSLNTSDSLWTVAAVFDDLPHNTHLDIKILTMNEGAGQNYLSNDSYTYLRIASETDIASLRQELEEVYQDVAYDSNPVMTVNLVPLRDIHLHSQSTFEMKPSGSINTVIISTALSALLIFIASFNFIKMSIAQAGKRAKEVGIRKALGAQKITLLAQFFFEYIVIVFISMVAACCIVELSLPSFGALIDRNLTVNFISYFSFILVLATVFIAVLAGAYPALYISAYNAKKVLSGDLQRGKSAALVRKLLFVIQAALSITLIIFASTIYQQINHLKTLPLGYQKLDRIEVSGLANSYLFENTENNLINKITRLNGVTNVSTIDLSLTNSINTTIPTYWPGNTGEAPLIPYSGTGFDIANAAGFEVLAGRDFSMDFSSDWLHSDGENLRASVLVTESLARQSGFSDINKIIGEEWLLGADKKSAVIAKVVGVIGDVRIGSVKDKPVDIMFVCGYTDTTTGNILVNVESGAPQSIQEDIAFMVQSELNIHDVKIHRLNDKYNNLYISDEREAKLILIFALLSILLTCIGIYGQTSFNTYLRGKELAIRKVIGASKINLINLMTKEFILLMLLSVTISTPLASFITTSWLENFYNKAPVNYLTYVFSILTVLFIVWSTVAAVTYKTISSNLSHRLRYE